jgi:hypothetical protein
MSGICKEVMYLYTLFFHLAQSWLFTSLILTYVGRTSLDFSLNYLACRIAVSWGFAIGCGGGNRGEDKARREGAMRSMTCIKVCIISLFDSRICLFDSSVRWFWASKTSISDGDKVLGGWDMRSCYARVSAEGRLRIEVGVVYSLSYVSSSVSFGVSVEGSISSWGRDIG